MQRIAQAGQQAVTSRVRAASSAGKPSVLRGKSWLPLRVLICMLHAIDHMLAVVVGWLKQQNRFATGMLYVCDHGESLGENGLYLHGMPWALAPDTQKHVPWIMWMGGLAQRSAVNWHCAAQTREQPLTHDNDFHTVLGLLGVQSPTCVQSLDMLSTCRAARLRLDHGVDGLHALVWHGVVFGDGSLG